MQTSSSTLLCFIASLLPSNLRESLAYSMEFHSAKYLRLHLPSALAHTSQCNFYEAFLLEDNQARERNDIKTHRGVSQDSVHTPDTALLPASCSVQEGGDGYSTCRAWEQAKKWQYSPVAQASVTAPI